ncbi:hypothetical protein D3C86_2037220 [compost metagenome]
MRLPYLDSVPYALLIQSGRAFDSLEVVRVEIEVSQFLIQSLRYYFHYPDMLFYRRQ